MFLSASPKALQILTDIYRPICIPVNIENDIVYNEEKTMCMCIKPSVMKHLYVLSFI